MQQKGGQLKLIILIINILGAGWQHPGGDGCHCQTLRPFCALEGLPSKWAGPPLTGWLL